MSVLRVCLFAFVWIALSSAGLLRARADDSGAGGPVSARRVIKRFDFDEPENVESVPMFWRKFEADGFPHFATGRFDPQVGHDSPPGFYLDANGGHVGYYYFARGIPAKPGSDYQVQAWIKPDHLEQARAYVSAYFMDRFGQRIEGTETRSPPVGGPEADDAWQAVKFILPGDAEDAALISVGLFVLQPDPQKQDHGTPRPILTSDVIAGAWFDDVTVLRLPRIRLSCSQPGGVFTHREVPTIRAEVADLDGNELTSTLVVRSADGQVKWHRRLDVRVPGQNPPPELTFPDLDAGVYTATLHIYANGIRVRAPELTFARLGPGVPGLAGAKRGLGLRVENDRDELWPDVTRLIDLLGVSQVKLSVWQDQRPAIRVSETTPGQSAFVAHVYRKNGTAVGTLEGVPQELRDPDARYRGTLLDLLSESSRDWSSFLQYALARYASFVDYWQIGADGDPDVIWDRRLGQTVNRLNHDFEELITNPKLVTPWSIQHVLPAKHIRSAAICLFVPRNVSPDLLMNYYEAFASLPFRQRWLTVDTLETDRYERTARLQGFVKRLVAAKATGADIVFVNQPWTMQTLLGRPVVALQETFLILRTLVAVLGNSEAMTPVHFGDGVHGYLFDRRGTGVVVLWNDRAPIEGSEVAMYLGGEPRQVSVWGDVSRVARSGTKHVFTVSAMPTIIDGVSTRLMMLRSAMRLEPDSIESSLTLHEVELRLTNPYREPISGRIRLDVPRGWDVSPLRMSFSLDPGKTFVETLGVRFPQVETAGRKLIAANLTLDSDREYKLQVPLELDLSIQHLGVTAIAQRMDDRVVVRQRVTNFSEVPVNYRGYVVVPGRPRQTRLIHNLHPGQTVVKQYDFPSSNDLAGKRVRVGLREVDGPKTYNQVIEVP